MKGKSWLVLFLVMFAGIVLGGFLGDLLGSLPYMGWLSYGKTFGFPSTTINLSILQLTFGIQVNMNIASIIGMCIGIFIYRKL